MTWFLRMETFFGFRFEWPHHLSMNQFFAYSIEFCVWSYDQLEHSIITKPFYYFQVSQCKSRERTGSNLLVLEIVWKRCFGELEWKLYESRAVFEWARAAIINRNFPRTLLSFSRESADSYKTSLFQITLLRVWDWLQPWLRTYSDVG